MRSSHRLLLPSVNRWRASGVRAQEGGTAWCGRALKIHLPVRYPQRCRLLWKTAGRGPRYRLSTIYL